MKEHSDKEKRYDNIVAIVDAFGRCVSTGIAVIDMDAENFLCVSDNYARLTHSSVERIKEKGFKWFDDIFDQESIRTLKAMDSKFKSVINKGETVSETDFTFTCVLRLKNMGKKNELVQYTITPICKGEDGQMRLMLTTMQYTHFKDQGHLKVENKEGLFFYDSVSSIWTKQACLYVTESDSELLAYALRGLSGKEIAEMKSVSDEAIKSQKGRMYDRYGVSSIEEAIGRLFNMGMQCVHWLRKLNKK